MMEQQREVLFMASTGWSRLDRLGVMENYLKHMLTENNCDKKKATAVSEVSFK